MLSRLKSFGPIFVFLIGIFGLASAFCSDAPATSVTPPAAEPATSMIWTVLLAVISGILAILGGFISSFFSWIKTKVGQTEAEQKAVDALSVGVTEAYNNFVKLAKDASADGKLTEEEKKQARQFAIDTAKRIAVGPAKDLLFAWGQPKLENIVQQLVAKMKGAPAPAQPAVIVPPPGT